MPLKEIVGRRTKHDPRSPAHAAGFRRMSLGARAEWKHSLAIMAAIAGTGLIPGRALVLFFAQLKSAMWPGILTASALFGAMAGFRARESFGGRTTGPTPLGSDFSGRLVHWLRSLFAALVTAVMLARTGKLGALTLPVAHGYAAGVAIAAVVALWLRASGPEGASAAGAAVYIAVVLFYAGMALDPRPVRLYDWCETELRLAGRLEAAIPLALLFACMNGAAAAWVRGPARGAVRPLGLGAKAGGMLCAALVLGALALMRGGDALLGQEMPWTVLSARWGTAGFWACALVEYACDVTALSASLGMLLGNLGRAGRRRTAAVCMLALSALLFAILTAEGFAR